jgi:alpha-L-fucosidase
MDKYFEKMLSDRMGLFVHYGLYSALGGKYRGEEIFGLGEWIMRRAEIPIAEYEAFARENFRPAPDFAKKLVRTAKDAGMRYVILTSKHHDGFCLFKSDADPYNSYEYFGRDIC